MRRDLSSPLLWQPGPKWQDGAETRELRQNRSATIIVPPGSRTETLCVLWPGSDCVQQSYKCPAWTADSDILTASSVPSARAGRSALLRTRVKILRRRFSSVPGVRTEEQQLTALLPPPPFSSGGRGVACENGGVRRGEVGVGPRPACLPLIGPSYKLLGQPSGLTLETSVNTREETFDWLPVWRQAAQAQMNKLLPVRTYKIKAWQSIFVAITTHFKFLYFYIILFYLNKHLK